MSMELMRPTPRQHRYRQHRCPEAEAPIWLRSLRQVSSSIRSTSSPRPHPTPDTRHLQTPHHSPATPMAAQPLAPTLAQRSGPTLPVPVAEVCAHTAAQSAAHELAELRAADAAAADERVQCASEAATAGAPTADDGSRTGMNELYLFYCSRAGRDPCLRCGSVEHTRSQCSAARACCAYCGRDHASRFCAQG